MQNYHIPFRVATSWFLMWWSCTIMYSSKKLKKSSIKKKDKQHNETINILYWNQQFLNIHRPLVTFLQRSFEAKNILDRLIGFGLLGGLKIRNIFLIQLIHWMTYIYFRRKTFSCLNIEINGGEFFLQFPNKDELDSRT